MKHIILSIILIVSSITAWSQVDYNNVYRYYQTGSSPVVKNVWKMNYTRDTTMVVDSVYIGCNSFKVPDTNYFYSYILSDSTLISTDSLKGYAVYPNQTGHSGKVLQTNGSTVSWQTVSGSGDNMGSHAATTDVDMNANDIIDVGNIVSGSATIDYCTTIDINVENIYGNGSLSTILMPSGGDQLMFLSTNGTDGVQLGRTMGDGSYIKIMGSRPSLSSLDVLKNSEIKTLIKDSLIAIKTTLNGKLTKNSAITGSTKTKITFDANGLVTAGVDAGISDILHLADSLTAHRTDINNRVVKNSAITGSTKTKITYDSKGLVTAGADIAQSDIPGLVDTLADHRDLLPPSPVGVTTGKILGVKVNEFNYYSKSELGIKDSAAIDNMVKIIVSDTADYLRTLGGGGGPGGSNNQFQYKNGSSFAGAANVEAVSGNLRLNYTSTPSVDTNGIILSSNVDLVIPRLTATDNISSYEILPSLRNKRIGFCVPQNGSSFNNFGLAIGAGASIQGTLTAPTFATTNIHTESNRVEILRTSASASNIAGFVANIANYQSEDGLLFDYIWGPATGVTNTTHRSFTGFAASTSVSDVDPSASYVNCFGFGWDDDDTNIQFMHNDGSGTCTEVDMGSNFAVATSDRTKWYRMIIENTDGVNEIHYRIIDLSNGNTTSGSVTSNLPSSTTFLGIRNVFSTGGTSSVNGIALGNLYIETNH